MSVPIAFVAGVACDPDVRMRWIAFGIGTVVVACGSSSNTPSPAAGWTDGGSDGGVSLLPFPVPVGDGGAAVDSGALVAIYGRCAGIARKPLTAGAWTDPFSGATLHWPTPWVQPDAGSGVVADDAYTYVPTGATAVTSTQANMTVSPIGVSSDTEGQQFLQSWVTWAQQHGGSGSQITQRLQRFISLSRSRDWHVRGNPLGLSAGRGRRRSCRPQPV